MDNFFTNYNLKEYKLESDKDIFKESDLKDCKSKLIYNNVKLLCPSYEKNTFRAILALDEELEPIYNSNSYFSDYHKYKNTVVTDSITGIHYDYNRLYDVELPTYCRINIIYEYMKQNLQEHEHFKEECVLFANPFSGVNYGHDLSIILNLINYYISNNLNCKIILLENSKNIPRAIEFIELFIPKDRFCFINENIMYKFERIHIIPSINFDIHKHKTIINKGINLAIQKAKEIYGNIDDLIGRNIFLVKTLSQNNVVTKSTAFICDKIAEKLQNDMNYYIINPEKEDNIYKIIVLLYFAKRVIVSGGGILYGHEIFFGDNTDLIFLRNWKVKTDPYNNTHRYKRLFINGNDINENEENFFRQLAQLCKEN
jgi:hypothetical protein